MGTRCLTVFHSEDEEKEIAVLYRQFDGYLSGHGEELAQFLSGSKMVNGLSGNSHVFNGMGCLAAFVIAHFKDRAGGFYLHPAGTRGCGSDYTYHIYGKERFEPEIEEESIGRHPASVFMKKIKEVEY